MRDNGAMMRHFNVSLLGLCCGLLWWIAATPAAAQAPRLESFAFSAAGHPEIKVWTALPPKVEAGTPILIAMHGMGRNAQSMRNAWSAFAAERGVIVAAPEFDAAHFPKAAQYNLGNTHDEKGRPRPREAWTFSIIEDLFRDLRTRTGSQVQHYSLFGHSAGAQFAHRLLLNLPDAHVARVISANAGYYVMPDASPAPYGFAASGIDDKMACEAYARPLLILLGGADNDPAHPQLNNSAGAKAQGPHRLARGQAFHAATEAHAARLKCPYRWALEVVPGVAHESDKMSRAAQATLSKSLSRKETP